MDIDRKKNFIIRFLFYAIAVLLFYFIFKYALGFLLPFIISFVLVYSVQKPSYLVAGKLKMKPKTVSVILVFLFYVLLFIIIISILFLAVKQFEKNGGITSLIGLASGGMKNVFAMFRKYENLLPEFTIEYVDSFAKEIPAKLGAFLTSVVSKIAASVPKILFGVVITVVSSCYFANEYEPLKNFFISVLPNGKTNFILAVKKVINDSVLKIIKGYSIISLMIFLICSVGLLLLRQKNAVVVAVAVALVDILPVLGVGTVLIPWCAIEFIKGDIFLGVGLIIIYLCSLAIHHILEPRFVGKNVGIPPFISLVLMFVLLKLFGFLGMIMALLTIIVIVNLYRDDIIS